MLVTTDEFSGSPAKRRLYPVAEWASSVFVPPADIDEPRACFKYDVDTNNVSRVVGKLLLQKDNSTWNFFSIDLFASRLHTKDRIEIQLTNVTKYQVTIRQ
jgi:hypothetical protein